MNLNKTVRQLFMTSIFSIHNHKKSVKQHPFRRISYLAVILAIIAIPFLSHQAFANTVSSTAQLYIDGKVVNVATNAKTVKGVIEDAGFTIGKNDKVEPSLDTEITDGYKINVYRAIPITVEDKGVNVEIETAQKTGEAIATEAGIPLNPEDKFNLQASDLSGNDLQPGLTMKVDRADTVNLNLYGAVSQVRTQEKTVGDFLAANKIQLQTGDTLLQPTDQPIVDGGTIEVRNDSREVAVVDEEIPMPERLVQDINQAVGYKSVQTPGAAGSKKATYEVKKANGKEISRTLISEVTIKEAVTQVSIVGVKKVTLGNGNVSDRAKELMKAAGIQESDWGYVDYIINRESHWNYTAQNPGNSAYGLCQTMMSVHKPGGDFKTNPITQLRWCDGYAHRPRYGSWAAAYNFWLKNGNW